MELAQLKRSLVMPIHNEADLLPLTLPSYYSPLVDEYVFVLDRCTDGSEASIIRWAEEYEVEAKVRLFRYSSGEWIYRACEVHNYAFSKATGDLIYYGDADIVYNPAAYQVKGCLDYGVTSFAVLVPKKFWDHLYTFLMTRGEFTYEGSHLASCLIVTPRKVFQQLGFTDTVSGDCSDYRMRVLMAGYGARHISSVKVNHLAYRRSEEFNRAKWRFVQLRNGLKLRGAPFYRVLLYAVLKLQPYVVVGYRITDEEGWMRKYDPYAPYA